ncbi:hypothetical protein L228DRAFT_281518 [Xylona heveae TC161]|uniref:Tim17-domain-containing protein n=1 Tax=Xylona heveae (strain CBS 132557 / TC161) TaxID=1328760 RepID=A0A165I691_XYLHT|nr:hypothetical protein L228DRAFT_281518 [Xylona heveae TC161]KZF24444.1 hypothetical protein L228DRAFT_281518 [Xylona heveae TC161]
MTSTASQPNVPPPATMTLPTDPSPELPETDRLGLPLHLRIPASMLGSFLAGVGMGLSQGSMMAGLRFRAENAHRLPQTPTGWYLYHKSKNYHMMLGGVREGLKMGTKVSVWVGGFFTVEEAVDRLRGGQKDFFSTVVAGLGIAGGFSLWHRFPVITAARTAKMGLLFGLGYGLTQDALSLLQGRRLAYVDFILGTKRKERRAAAAAAATADGAQTQLA